MEAYVASGTDFAVETTLSGRAYARRIRHWQARGYSVAIIYLRLPSAGDSVERVAQRVKEGGHDIPEAVVRRRFGRSWTNFRELYREVANEWLVYDSSVRPAATHRTVTGLAGCPRATRCRAINGTRGPRLAPDDSRPGAHIRIDQETTHDGTTRQVPGGRAIGEERNRRTRPGRRRWRWRGRRACGIVEPGQPVGPVLQPTSDQCRT